MGTDIRGAVQMGYKTILVLTGMTKKEDLPRYAFKPDLVVESAGDIKLPLAWW
jgi:NagD protein